MAAGEEASMHRPMDLSSVFRYDLSQRSNAYLSAWIDWNGDGVFDDSDGSREVISHTWNPVT